MKASNFLIRALILSLSAASLQGCPSPAAPPSPPAEVPSALVFPLPLIDASKIAHAPADASQAGFVAPGGEFSNEIGACGDHFNGFNNALTTFFSPLRQFAIPANEQTKMLEKIIPPDPGSPDSGIIEVKIDFSDFDIDGHGERVGCSGNTGSLPVCFRIWVQEGGAVQTRIAGFFTDFPTADNSGVGRLLISSPQLGGVTMAVNYDYKDPANKTSELFARFTQNGSLFVSGHAIFAQNGPDETALKTLSAASALFLDDSFQGAPNGSVQFISKFLEDNDLWNGADNAENATAFGFTKSVSDVCALISTGDAASSLSDCLNVGIDIGGLSFLDFATDTDFLIPSALPQNPTF